MNINALYREAPFNLDEVLNKILHFRAQQLLSENVVSSYMELEKKVKTTKESSEDFHKKLSNQIFGIRADSYRKIIKYLIF